MKEGWGGDVTLVLDPEFITALSRQKQDSTEQIAKYIHQLLRLVYI